MEEKRPATNPQIKQDHKHDWSLDARNPHVDGLRQHIEIGRKENYVTDHDLCKVQQRKDQSPSLMQQDADTKRDKDYSLYRHRDVCRVTIELDAKEDILERRRL
jgi:hypothetical protein